MGLYRQQNKRVGGGRMKEEELSEFIDHIIDNKLTKKDFEFYKKNKKQLDNMSSMFRLLFGDILKIND